MEVLPTAPGATVPALPDNLHGYEGRTLYQEEEEALAGIPWEKARAYLRALSLTGQAGKACKLAGISVATATYWRQNSPLYVSIENALREDIKARANDLATNRVLNGFREKMYNGKGELKGTRIREDPSFTRAWLASIDENWRPNDQGAAVIQINVLQAGE